MSGLSWDGWVTDTLAQVRAAGQWRVIRDLDLRERGVTGVVSAEGSDRAVVTFASNDYLGLSAHPAVVAAAVDALERWGSGAGASRLVTGARPVHSELEDELAAWKGADGALLFPTGYAANLSVLAVLGGPDVTVFSDELNHASIIDGCRLSRSRVVVYRHRDVAHLDSLLADIEPGGRAIVVTDTVFSMDGDVAPLDELRGVCRRHGALLVVDEAHAVFPQTGVAQFDMSNSATPEWVVRVGTLSKFLGSLGGFVAGPAPFIDLLRNRARPFIFTTAPTPADSAAALAALRIFRSPEGESLRARLRAHVDRVAPGHPTPIIPVIVGGEQDALDASAYLLDRGLFVPAIRPPTVPSGTARLRVTLSAAHTDDEVARLLEVLAELRLDVHAA